MRAERGRGKAKDRSKSRPSLFDFMDEAQRDSQANKFCKKTVLRDEASVEDFFVSRLVGDLDYTDEEIRPKESLAEILVARGRRKELYRPDYAIICSDKPRWLIDAKAPTENVDDWSYQGAGYALGLNREYTGENPCQYYVITNGLMLKVFKWDEKPPVLTLEFSDFVEDNPNFLALRSLLAAKVARQGWVTKKAAKSDAVVLTKPPTEQVKRIFNNCHRLIWKTEKMNPQAAFFEFVKVMFVKLWEDRKLREDPTLGPLITAGQPIPRGRLVFSTRWMESLQERGVENPIERILFQKLAETLREGVARGKKKPIFEEGERIRLQVGTMKQVVERLESYDMFGIDEDLNGRLFETFLSATMRGEALGQYFTPRSIVKLMERLAAPVANRDKIDRILDACCGTAGFLIEVLTDMRSQIRDNSSLTSEEAANLLDKLANDSIFGIDAGREPPLARIARVNMYLHGDGGSRIYAADSLDKSVHTGIGDDPQSRLELEELRTLLRSIQGGSTEGFDIVLTNPPFAMTYSAANDSEREVLQQYALSVFGLEGTTKRRPSLRSSIMFIERHGDLLKEHGKLITVIDDSVLSGKNHTFARDFIRSGFIVRAVISLPGDAFQRVGARAKTSILYLVPKARGETEQPDVFMFECQFVGLDDVPMKTRPSVALDAKRRAEQEIDEVVQAFRSFLAGQKGPWLVPALQITDRLDVKSCLPRPDEIEKTWLQRGLDVVPLGNIVDHITEGGFDPKQSPNQLFTLLRVRYDGVPEEGETVLGEELTYSYVQHSLAGDLVMSNIAAALGSTCVIPHDLQHAILSSEFTIMRVKDPRFAPWFLWGYMRSAEVRARLLSKATGISRHRVGWNVLQTLPVPTVAKDVQEEIGKQFKESISRVREAERTRAEASTILNSLLDLENQWAVQRLRAAKPPK